jgi:hypothetical protein
MSEENENTFTCQYCGLTYDSEEELENHVLSMHYEEVEQKLSKIQNIARENPETIEKWKNDKKKEFLLKIAENHPQTLHIIQTSPHSEEMLDKMVQEELFKEALRTNTASSFDLMWLKDSKFQEIYDQEKKKKKTEQYPYPYEHKYDEEDNEHRDESTGQSETFWKDPQDMIEETEVTNVRENLSDNEDMKKRQLVKILFALTRDKKKR